MAVNVILNVRSNPLFQRAVGWRGVASGFSYERVIRKVLEAADERGAEESARRLSAGQSLSDGGGMALWDRDLKEETSLPITGVTTGVLPNWLSGTLVRNGPGVLSFGSTRYNHLFDGLAVLQRFKFENGEVTYQNRILRSTTYEKNSAAGRIVVSEFGTKRVPDPCQTIFQRFKSYFESEEPTDNCSVAIYPYGDEVYALTEVPIMYRVHPQTLETFNRVDIRQEVGVVHHSAHPHVEESGLVSNVGLLPDGTSGFKYAIVQFPNTKSSSRANGSEFSKAELAAQIPCRWRFHPSYMHSFGLTENYYLLIEQPMCLSLPDMLLAKIYPNRQPFDVLKWYQDQPTLLHVVHRTTGERTVFEAEPFFFFHTINQYEDTENGCLVLDLCVFKDPQVMQSLNIELLRTASTNPDFAKMFRARPVRFVLPLSTPGAGSPADPSQNLVRLEGSQAQAYRAPEDGTICVLPELLADIGCELPRVHYPAKLGKKYRYFYAISTDLELQNPGTLIKVDTEKKMATTWSEPGLFPSEPIFVPSPEPKTEDDGVVVSALIWEKEPHRVGVLVLDARTMRQLALTEFKGSRGPIPRGFHGWLHWRCIVESGAVNLIPKDAVGLAPHNWRWLRQKVRDASRHYPGLGCHVDLALLTLSEVTF